MNPSQLSALLVLSTLVVACETTELEVIEPRGLTVSEAEGGASNPGPAQPELPVPVPAPTPAAPMTADAGVALEPDADAGDGATAHACAVADVETATSYLLSLRATGACLRDRGAAPSSDSVVSTQVAPCDAEQSAFLLRVTLQGYFTIYHAATSRNLDVFGADVSLGTRLVLYTPLGWRHQQFRFVAEGDGYFFTISPVDDAELCVSQVNDEIRLARCTGSEWQQWQLLDGACVGAGSG